MSKNYRAKWHDYTRKCVYHITLMKSPGLPPFGHIAGDYRVAVGTRGSSFLAASPLGRAVKDALREISSIHPALRVYQYALMPDHLHILLGVEGELDEILGRKIGWFKLLVNKKANQIGVFDAGFHDCILNPSREFSTVVKYLRENPYRLAVRQANPNFFTRRTGLIVGDTACQAYGNVQLLDNPFKEQVVVHRSDTPKQFADYKERLLHTAANGGVLVSPFISAREKEIRNEAEELGARFILIRERPLTEREKPSARDFALCSSGRMLIVAPQEALDFSRRACVRMNSLAKAIAGGDAEA